MTAARTTLSLDEVRRAFAEELRIVCGLTTPGLVDALGDVPRERFLGPGPWLVRGDDDAPRRTPTADPRDVHHNVSVAIDPARQLFNGQPGLVARWIERLAVRPGDRVLHIGCATGYYTALLARLTGPDGRVTAIDVDPELAAAARANLADVPWVTVVPGDGRTRLPSGNDALLVHAGATHVLDEWLEAMAVGGRLLVPLTCTMPGVPASLSKGTVLTATSAGGGAWTATVGSMVMIYALVGLRDEADNAALGQALRQGTWHTVTRIRREPHDPETTCWLHRTGACLSA